MTDILMPALSPTMTEGKLARWLKKPGDAVAPGDVVAEIETDKATMEVEAIDEGTLGEIKVPEGTEGVAVNAVIATLVVPGETPATPRKAAPSPPPSLPHQGGGTTAKILPLDGGGLGGGDAAPRAAPTNGHASTQKSGKRIIASPLARRLARQAGIDLSAIRGSGPHGRIVRADLEGAPKGKAAPAAGAPAAPLARGPDARHLADLLGMPYELRPNSNFRKTVARRLTEAKQTIPHFYLTIDCEIDALLELRKRLNASADAAGGKASVNDFVIRAAALALRKKPDANVSWGEDAIVAYRDVDISVAVATPNGLITPIVRQADTKSLRQIAVEMHDLAERAREGKLKPQEYQGGTFSISNLGMYGIREFAAVINPPHSCILAVGNGEQRPVVRGGQLAVATLMSCTLSVDHRAVDGALGAEYLRAFKSLIEDPYGLLL